MARNCLVGSSSVVAMGLAGSLLGSVAAGSSAVAADMPAQAPVYAKAPPAAAVASSWTGFYLGGNLGLSVGRNRTGFPAFNGFDNEQFTLSPFGVVGGGQVGYNWQAAPNWVFGVEADFQGSSQGDATTCVSECTTDGFLSTKFTQKLLWFGTVRGRLGWTNGPALFYGTGGLAYGRVTTDFNVVDGDGSAVGSFSQNNAGWTVGAGVEAQLFGNWTGKIEYLYIDLGNVSGRAVGTDGFAPSSRVQDHIVRLGVNYKFGDSVDASAGNPMASMAPVVVSDWFGTYVGGNIGLAVARNTTSAPILPGPGNNNEQSTLSPLGLTGGAQIGFNWQTASHWVTGIETDFQVSGQRDSQLCIRHCVAGDGFEKFSQTIPWFGTLRAREGWTNGRTLFYATGGLAYGKIKTDMNFNQLGSVVAGNFSQIRPGWTVGAGIESKLVGNWTAKIEYLFVDLGTVTGASPLTTGLLAGETITFSSRVQDHIVRLGLNYKL